MTRVIVVFMLFLLWTSAAYGLDDVIALYSDQSYEDCSLTDGGAGTVTVYIVHESGSSRTASQFMIEPGSGVGLSYVSESTTFLFIGDTQSGITVAYAGCENAPVLVATITYFTTGTSSTCSTIRVVPDPNSLTGTIEVVDCSETKSEGVGGKLVNLYIRPVLDKVRRLLPRIGVAP